MQDDMGQQPLNPAAMSLADVARLLSKIGRASIDIDMLRADVAEGAPTNPDGTINLVSYAAWLVKEMAQRGH